MIYQELGNLCPAKCNYQHIIDDLLKILDDDYEIYFFMYGPTLYGEAINYEDIEKIQYQKSNVVWIVIDGFLEDYEFDWYRESRPKACIEFEKVCLKYPKKHFFMISNMCNLDKTIIANNFTTIETPLLSIFPLKHSTVKYHHGYQTKSSTTFQWTCFISNPWWHRIGLVSYLLSQNLESFGALSVSQTIFKRCQQFKHIYNCLTYKFSRPMYQLLDTGYQKLLSQTFQS
jgi:hypothetical protein